VLNLGPSTKAAAASATRCRRQQLVCNRQRGGHDRHKHRCHTGTHTAVKNNSKLKTAPDWLLNGWGNHPLRPCAWTKKSSCWVFIGREGAGKQTSYTSHRRCPRSGYKVPILSINSSCTLNLITFGQPKTLARSGCTLTASSHHSPPLSTRDRQTKHKTAGAKINPAVFRPVSASAGFSLLLLLPQLSSPPSNPHKC
jgi:hypothetical protein